MPAQSVPGAAPQMGHGSTCQTGSASVFGSVGIGEGFEETASAIHAFGFHVREFASWAKIGAMEQCVP